MKKLIFMFGVLLLATSVFAQSDDDLFGGSDDDFFADDSIIEVDDVSAKTDLSKGVIFESGSIKVGGKIDASLGTETVLYADDDASFGDHLKDTTLTPKLDAFLTVDARPIETLRMYTKFGFAYPFEDRATTVLAGMDPVTNQPIYSTSVNNWFKLKELFTDFSVKDTAFFRFGIHTVTWGTGYFFSPVSDIINAAAIDPENPTAQVDGVLNLRTQIIIPDTQNCFWFYVVPSTEFNSETTAQSYAKKTALAAKYEFLAGNWEFGAGAYWKYENAPKFMVTASGSLESVSFFGEAVYSYGAVSEWAVNTDWSNKKHIFQVTAGASRYWKEPMINLIGQYYYDGNDKDMNHAYVTYGHNIAGALSFGKIFGNKDLTANLYAIINFGKEDLPDMLKDYLESNNMLSFINAATFSAMINYTPF